MIAEPVHDVGRPRPEVVRGLVGYRLPAGSLVLDVAGRDEPVLAAFADDYRILAVTPEHGPGRRPRPPTVRADPTRLPLAAASVDCVLLLDAATVGDDRRLDLIEAGRVLRSGGLTVMAAAGGSGRAAAQLTSTMRELGLIPEQVHHLQVLRHPVDRPAGAHPVPPSPRLTVAGAAGRSVAVPGRRRAGTRGGGGPVAGASGAGRRRARLRPQAVVLLHDCVNSGGNSEQWLDEQQAKRPGRPSQS
ncbi:MAG: methyltransferase domain-containing protein [Acidimicrobiales bacterium]